MIVKLQAILLPAGASKSSDRFIINSFDEPADKDILAAEALTVLHPPNPFVGSVAVPLQPYEPPGGATVAFCIVPLTDIEIVSAMLPVFVTVTLKQAELAFCAA